MKMKFRAVVLAAGVIGILGGFLWGTVVAGSGRTDQAPAAVLESVQKTFPGARIRRVKARPKIIQIYDVDLVEDGRRAKAEVVLNGEILTVYRQISAGDAPRAVFRSITREMGEGELERLVKKERHATISISSFGRPQVQYQAIVEKGERRMRLTLSARGRIINRELSEEGEEGEREVSLEEVPEPVREAILRHAGEHRVREVEMFRRGGRLYYEAEWGENGREVEVTVDENGRVMGREMEEDEDEEYEDD